MSSNRAGRALVLLLLGAYHLNLRQVSTDTAASRLVPLSLVRDGDFALDEFRSSKTLDIRAGEPLPFYLVESHGHIYDAYPPVAAILAAPIYAIPSWLGLPHDSELLANVFSKLAASLMAAASAWLVWRALLGLGHGPRTAWAVAAVYGLATPIWSTASQGLWSHTPAVWMFALAIWALTRRRLGIAMTATAIGGVARPVMLLALPVVLAAGIDLRRRDSSRALRSCAGAAAVLCAAAIYNLHVCGSVLGTAEARNSYWNEVFGVRSMWDGNFGEGLLGLAICPSRGLLVYSPIVALALVGAWMVWRRPLESPPSRPEHIARACAVVCGVAYLVYAKYLVWWGGHSYGPRYLTDVMPFAAPLMAVAADRLGLLARSRPAWRAAWGGALVYSVVVQAIGAFCWPSHLEGPIDFAYYRRLWSPNNQIVKCIRAGPVVDKTARRVLTRMGLRLGPAPRFRPSAPSNGFPHPLQRSALAFQRLGLAASVPPARDSDAVTR